MPVDTDRGVEAAECLVNPGLTAQDCVVARDDPAVGDLCFGHQSCGDISASDVLAQSGSNLFAKIFRELDHGHSLPQKRAARRLAAHRHCAAGKNHAFAGGNEADVRKSRLWRLLPID
jgi:hypothetical protein